MYKFLGCLHGDCNLSKKDIAKLEQIGNTLIKKYPPQLDVKNYMIMAGEFRFKKTTFQLMAHYYGDDFEKLRIFFFHNGEKEKVLYLKQPFNVS